MKYDFLHSTVFKITALMFCISSMAIVSMFSSVFISDHAQSDALAVNVAGSLRMQSYRMLAQAQLEDAGGENETVSIDSLIEKFESDLNNGALTSQLILEGSPSLKELHAQVKSEWLNRVKPVFIKGVRATDNQAVSELISGFVTQIDNLVTAYQRQAEHNIANIRLIQSVALFVTLLMTAFAMLIINRHIEKPLSTLTNVAKRIGQGDFTTVAKVDGKGELTVLANTMNNMSQSIHRSQSYLEEKVRTKTKALRQSNSSLELLFKTSSMLNHLEPGNYHFDPIITQLAEVTGIEDIDLCIMTPSCNKPFAQLHTVEKELPEKCAVRDCDSCIGHVNAQPPHISDLKYPLNKYGINYGVLVVRGQPDRPMEEWQHQLFESLAEQIATGLHMMQQQEQDRRIALMAERTVIARELHDSLAQALSYLKIQVSRLQKLQQKENVQEQVDEVMGELRNGLNSAYRELRELLTTFRLKLDGDSLKAAFEQTIQQLKSRSDEFEFHLDYQLEHIPFSPQEEIHMLQIARESMQNAFYHSKGKNIRVSVAQEGDLVTLSVCDDGVGIPDDPNKLNHYGLAIIQERSRSLGGEVAIQKGKEGGTQVHFRFVPEYTRSQQVKMV